MITNTIHKWIYGNSEYTFVEDGMNYSLRMHFEEFDVQFSDCQPMQVVYDWIDGIRTPSNHKSFCT
jgi:hypothetical protein